MFGAGLGFLLMLPILIGQWIGVVHLGKGGRNGAWWSMAAGTVFTSLGTVLSGIFMYLLLSRMSSGGGFQTTSIFVAMSTGLSGLGSLLFAVGFAMHGIVSAKFQHRVRDLESVLAAQVDQMDRKIDGPSS